ncbi:hypothetical protein HDU67_001380 [Dinochytrium kinnereticum]|nr:hypothetical protein HDU67_001380 [Dinochytrium kinnereticum]
MAAAKPATVPPQVRGVAISGWEKQQELRKQREIVKTLEKELRDEAQAEKDAKKKAAEERRKRKEENERKAEIVQIVSAAKVKRMKKKQLRMVRKAAGSGHTDKIKSKTKK